VHYQKGKGRKGEFLRKKGKLKKFGERGAMRSKKKTMEREVGMG